MTSPLILTGSNYRDAEENNFSALIFDDLFKDKVQMPDMLSQENNSSDVHKMSSSDDLLNDEAPYNVLSQDEDVELCPTLSSNKRKRSQKEVNGEMQKRAKRKRYRPKVVSQFPKIAKKLSESRNTPRPVAPKQRKSYVRKSAKTTECQRPLFVDDGESISLPFLENFNNTKIEQGGFESSTITNASAIEYNSLQSYQKLTSLSSLCVVENRRIGGNFPIMCKRKRVKRERINLVKLLNPFAKGNRSKTFIRKRKCWKDFYVEGNSTISRKMKTIIKKIISSNKKIHRKEAKRNVRKNSRELALYKRPLLKVDVKFDEETLRVWNLLVAESRHDEEDEHKRRYWEEIREAYHGAVETFLSRVHTVQGDRRFLPWKGSVLDSIGGVFLTQNVSDYSSSSAFMSLAARFPIKSVSREQSNNMIFSDPKSDKKMNEKKVEETEAQKTNESSKVVNEAQKVDESSKVVNKETQNSLYFIERNSNSSGKKEQAHNTKKSKKEEEKKMILKRKRQHWEALRKIYTKSDRHIDHVDSIDWEAVRNAKVGEVAEAIKMRGQHNNIARKIQIALNSFLIHHGTTDLEWLKDIPPKEAKEYLLNIFGFGLKSVECLRLLTLQHISFPVDVNVGRIVVRLGWVPLQPLPESIQIHNLEQFPDPIKIQQYLWPRLCKLDHHTLYELHYQMITFGKVFCTKRNPNCNACPMKDKCKYYASSLARTKLALPPKPSTDQSIVTQMDHVNAYSFPYFDCWSNSTSTLFTKKSKECEPIVEMPASPELESTELIDDEKMYYEYDYAIENDEDIEDMMTLNLSSQESWCFSKTCDDYFQEFDHGMNASTSLVAIHPNATNNPLSKMKNASRLKTERTVYVLTDNHPLLTEYPPREHDDPSPYLLVIWQPDELESSDESNKTDLHEEDQSSQTETVPGTLLIPCRTAMKARFPLNGTYFQVNEVFADYASMIQPINVPRKWIWNLEKRITYFGTGTSTITRGLSMEEIRDFFCKGFICVRAIDTTTGAPRPISSILHRNTTHRPELGRKKIVTPNELQVVHANT